MSAAPDALSLPLDGIRAVEASAGTGKTFTIATLYLRLILERGLKVDEVVVATFTRAAAAELSERLRRRRVVAIVADEMHADHQATEARVEQGGEVKMLVPTAHKNVGRAVIGLRGLHEIKAGRHAHHDIALFGLQRIADEAATLRPPGVGEGSSQGLRHHRSELVLESGLGAVRKWQVVRIGADTKRAIGRGGCRGRDPHQAGKR